MYEQLNQFKIHPDVLNRIRPYIDLKYQMFMKKMLPRETVILGVRLPVLRKIAQQVIHKNKDEFLLKLTTETFEERMLYGFIIALMKEPFSIKQKYIDTYLNQIDNWSLCDSFCAALRWTSIEKQLLFPMICTWLKSDSEYRVRTGIVMLINHYIDAERIDICLKLFERVYHTGYYAQMAVAWAVSVCFVKFPKQTESFLAHNQLKDWTHNKSLQKIYESHRVSPDEKERMKQYKR